jgi:hypothetical protein
MKYIGILFLVLFSCTSKTPEEKAVAAVEDYIKQNADDPKSYEPVSFRYEKAWTNSVPQKISGFKIDHQYRIKNKLGGLVLSRNIFYLDSSYHVFKVED